MTESGGKRRLFFALWPDDALRRAIERETRSAAKRSGGRIIPTENLHITLAFLGAVPESQVTDALTCRQAVRVEPFELSLRRLVWWKRQQMLCLEPEESDRSRGMLADLALRLQSTLRHKGFELERRPFRPHLTLARNVRSDHEFKFIKGLRWQVDRMELIESHTLPSGSVYSVLVPPSSWGSI